MSSSQKMMILDDISKPSDIKNLTLDQLGDLCQELRSEIVSITSRNGGHLGSNLGSIELIVAAHYVFDIETDKFVFDVGHQAYSHKILTGRRKLMENLRSKSGASGFIDPSESKYDHFISGHASTSMSAALGIAKARDLNNENFKVISMLGDGSLSGGMIYEAMNNAFGTKNFVVILNDNQMSISESVGAMRKYLSKLLSSKVALFFRKIISKLISLFPSKISLKIQKILKPLVSLIQGNNIFEEFGFQYIGPIDGHNLEELIRIFKNVRDVANYKPVIIHTVTQKGKGYSAAENDVTKLHGIDNSKKKRYSDAFGEKILELAENDPKIVCITAAMKTGTGLTDFAKVFPERFFDVGIAEEHAVTFAAGLAKQGFKPFVCIYSTFIQRAFDQIFHDVVLQNLPVKFMIDKAGFPGADGKTHAGLYDISLLQNFKNFAIMSPSSKNEFEKMIEFAVKYNESPLAIRFPKVEAMGSSNNHNFSIKCHVIQEGEGTLIVSVGCMLAIVWDAVELSKSNPTILDARFIQPFDFETFYKYAQDHDKIIFLEEGVFGGFSNLVLERLIKDKRQDLICKIKFLNASKEFAMHSSREDQLINSGFSPVTLANLICPNKYCNNK